MKKKKKSVILPKKIKFPKLQKGHLQPIERKKSTTHLYYGIYGLKVLMHSRFNEYSNRSSDEDKFHAVYENKNFYEFVLFQTFLWPKKPSEIRMGKGKGSGFDHWVARVKTGQIIFELTSYA